METKESLLAKIREATSAGIISRDEIISATNTIVTQTSAPVLTTENKEPKLQKIFYYIGGIIVMIGLIVLIFNHWRSFSTTARIWVTLGVAIACYLISLSLYFSKQAKALNQIFHFIAALLLPTGIGVLLYELGHNFYGFESASIIFASAYLVELVIYVIAKEKISLIFSTIFGVIAFFALTGHSMLLATLLGAVLVGTNILFLVQNKKTSSVFLSILFSSLLYFQIINWIVQANFVINTQQIFDYASLFYGLSIIILTWVIVDKGWKKIGWIWYLVGSVSFFGAMFSLSGFKPDENLFWMLMIALFVFVGMFASVFLRSRIVLFASALALISFVIKLTVEYFADSLGWPLALVIVGILLMVVGYVSVYVSRKYLGPKNPQITA